MFYLGGIGLALFLTLLLFSKSNKSIADKILAIWLVLITAHLLLFYFTKEGLYRQTLAMDMPLPLVHGPFLYLYTRALTNRVLSLRLTLVHFIPPLAVVVYIIPFLALPLEQKMFVYENNGAGYETFMLIKTVAVNISGVFYVILSSLALRKHRGSIADHFSNTEKINLQWLQYLIYWIGVIWVLVFIGNDDWIFGAVVLLVLFMGFFGIRQVGIFYSPEGQTIRRHEINGLPEPKDNLVERLQADSMDSDQEQSGKGRRKYQKSGLTQEGSESLHRQLVKLMRDEKPYCESELSLTDLAARLNIQPNYLSQVINEQEGKSFYDYINSLRVEEFIRLADSPDSKKFTLLALAERCGFNSKSSFNRYFKKVTGHSPSEFMSVSTK